jgi:hypothetical protein
MPRTVEQQAGIAELDQQLGELTVLAAAEQALEDEILFPSAPFDENSFAALNQGLFVLSPRQSDLSASPGAVSPLEMNSAWAMPQAEPENRARSEARPLAQSPQAEPVASDAVSLEGLAVSAQIEEQATEDAQSQKPNPIEPDNLHMPLVETHENTQEPNPESIQDIVLGEENPDSVETKPADVEAKPADVEAKPADVEAKPADVEAKPIDLSSSIAGSPKSEEKWKPCWMWEFAENQYELIIAASSAILERAYQDGLSQVEIRLNGGRGPATHVVTLTEPFFVEALNNPGKRRLVVRKAPQNEAKTSQIFQQ